MYPIMLFGPSVASLSLLALGVSFARSKNAHRSWGVLSSVFMLFQAFLLVGAVLFVGTGGQSLVAICLSPVFLGAFFLWLACFVGRILFARRERQLFPNDSA